MDRQLLLEHLLDTIQDGIVFMDADFNIVTANKTLEDNLSHKLPLVGKKCYEAFHRRTERCPACPLLAGSGSCAPPKRTFCHPPQQVPAMWYEVNMYRLQDPDGRVTGAIGHIKDITEHAVTEERLRDEITRRRILVEQSRDGIVVMNQGGAVYEANERYARMLGYSMEEICKLHIWDWDAQYTKEELLVMIDEVDKAGDVIETRHRRKDGSLLEVEISSNGAVIGGEKYIFCVCRDVTEKKAMERQIRELAIRDPLTEVYNRRYIFERLAETAAEYSRGETDFCVAIFDLDHFKAINDTYGHRAGDFALKEFTRMVGSLTREYDLLARCGGEEFMLMSRNSAGPDTIAMIERLLEVVRSTALTFEGHDIEFTCSCGVADSSEFPREEFSVEALLSLADARLYEAKAAGRDRCVGPTGEPASVRIRQLSFL
ncbi:MAG: diguanylate cyclase [Thermoleophilia bacterium]|nr:diguanylate cyclase [Thermoleophilia bacterium]